MAQFSESVSWPEFRFYVNRIYVLIWVNADFILKMVNSHDVDHAAHDLISLKQIISTF